MRVIKLLKGSYSLWKQEGGKAGFWDHGKGLKEGSRVKTTSETVEKGIKRRF
jgi:hypothetical protein